MLSLKLVISLPRRADNIKSIKNAPLANDLSQYGN